MVLILKDIITILAHLIEIHFFNESGMRETIPDLTVPICRWQVYPWFYAIDT